MRRVEFVSPKGATEAAIILKQHPVSDIEGIVKQAACKRLPALPPRWGLGFSRTEFQGFGPSGLHPWLLSVAPLGLQAQQYHPDSRCAAGKRSIQILCGA